jgi:hypothetical protein
MSDCAVDLASPPLASGGHRPAPIGPKVAVEEDFCRSGRVAFGQEPIQRAELAELGEDVADLRLPVAPMATEDSAGTFAPLAGPRPEALSETAARGGIEAGPDFSFEMCDQAGRAGQMAMMHGEGRDEGEHLHFAAMGG